MRKNLKYILPVLAGIALLALAEFLSPKPVDWRMTYSQKDRIPYGNFVLFSEIGDILGEEPYVNRSMSAYEYFYEESFDSTNYIIITTDLDADKESVKSLLDFAAQGNSLFIAASDFGGLADTLKFDTKVNIGSFSQNMQPDSIAVRFVNPRFGGKKYFLRRNMPGYFSEFDTARAVVLGDIGRDMPNFLAIPFGKGRIFLHSMPLAFTNYTMLSDRGAEYIASALSYLPSQYTIWDEFYKPFRQDKPQTPLRYILSRDGLRWAYYLTIGGLVLFILLEAKRRQRIIPVIAPPRNATVEFTETVGRLYFQHGNHKNLSEKKIQYFFDYLRSRFNEKDIDFSDEFYGRIAGKSGLDREETARIFTFIEETRASADIDEGRLLKLNELMEEFKTKSVR